MTIERTLDRITDDGPRDPDDIPGLDDLEDEDAAFERQRQQEHDEHTALADHLKDALPEIALMQSPENWWD